MSYGPLARFALEVITKKEGSTFPWRGTDEQEGRERFDAAVACSQQNRRVRLWLTGGIGAPSMLLDRNLEASPMR